MTRNNNLSHRRNASLTFDIEDYFQVENLRNHFPIDRWEDITLRLEEPTRKILDLLDKYEVKATFFVLGWIAEKIPSLVMEISRRGHEIASHGFSHRLNNDASLTHNDLKSDIKASKKTLEEITGKEVIGYRAPSFSISDEVLDILQEVGYKYDSSLFRFKMNSRYGQLSKTALRGLNETSFIKEFEIPTAQFPGLSVPFAGGAYFRILPLWMVKLAVLTATKTASDAVVFYFHPWEFDPMQPKVKNLPINRSIRHYWGLKRNLKRLEEITLFLKRHDFTIRPLHTFCG